MTTHDSCIRDTSSSDLVVVQLKLGYHEKLGILEASLNRKQDNLLARTEFRQPTCSADALDLCKPDHECQFCGTHPLVIVLAQ
jgi:hypothetical protein